MGDPEGLVEASVYMVIVGLSFPLLQKAKQLSPTLAVVLLIVEILPIPIWIAANRFGVPNWLERLMIWNCWAVMGLTGLGMLWLMITSIAS